VQFLLPLARVALDCGLGFDQLVSRFGDRLTLSCDLSILLSLPVQAFSGGLDHALIGITARLDDARHGKPAMDTSNGGRSNRPVFGYFDLVVVFSHLNAKGEGACRQRCCKSSGRSSCRYLLM
jgi:hypothetical protein